MSLTAFLEKLKNTPNAITFQETIAVIEAHYDFEPTAFENGLQHNMANENNGSCKVFAFAQLHNLSAETTLACFGAYYTEDVLKNPNGTDHQNIRNFMKTGWDGIAFYGEPLTLKQQ